MILLHITRLLADMKEAGAVDRNRPGAPDGEISARSLSLWAAEPPRRASTGPLWALVLTYGIEARVHLLLQFWCKYRSWKCNAKTMLSNFEWVNFLHNSSTSCHYTCDKIWCFSERPAESGLLPPTPCNFWTPSLLHQVILTEACPCIQSVCCIFILPRYFSPCFSSFRPQRRHSIWGAFSLPGALTHGLLGTDHTHVPQVAVFWLTL